MKSNLIILIYLFLFFSCKKKEDDPQPPKPDEITYQTDFSDLSWNTYSNTRYTSSYESESYKIRLDTTNWMADEFAPYVDQLDYTYYMQVDVKFSLDNDTKLAHAGFSYNYVDTANYCIMSICTNGTFYAYQKTNSQFKILFYNTVSKDLIKGSEQTNTIALRQYENSQEIFFNGVSQGNLPFAKERGYRKVGLCVLADQQLYTPFSTTFDNFVIKKIY
ncbi:MAG: hypothetical protein JWM14_902 [Chitinophagaceae bacterium]|nr:hypothetical protein [Chitinophagaceae bacterium]